MFFYLIVVQRADTFFQFMQFQKMRLPKRFMMVMNVKYATFTIVYVHGGSETLKIVV